MAEPQILKTKHHGDIQVIESYQVEGMHICKTPFGYVHSSGLAVTKEQLKKCLPAAKVKEALEWWDKRHEMADSKPMRIMVGKDGKLWFEDGSEVISADQIDASIEPGPARENMRRTFYVQQDRELQERHQMGAKPKPKLEEPPPPRKERLAQPEPPPEPEPEMFDDGPA